VQRDRRRGRVSAVLKRPRDREMRLAAARRAERGVGGIADPAMAEVVGVRTMRADDPAAPQLIQGADECLLRHSGSGGQHVRGERAPDRRADPGQLSGGPGQPRQAASDHRLHLRRGRGRIGPQRLDDEQRAALAVAVQAPEFGRVKRRPRDALGQQRRLRAAEPVKLDLGAAPERLQRRRQASEWMALVEFLAPGGCGDEQPCRRRRAHQVVDHAQGLRVGPLRIVDDQQQRCPCGQQRAPDRVEQPVPQLRLG